MKTRSVVMTSAGLLLVGCVAIVSLSQADAPPTPPPSPIPPTIADDGTLSLSVSFDEPVMATGDLDSVAFFEIDAGAATSNRRAPVALAVILDVSDSMYGNKIANARSAAHALVDQLDNGDILSLVSFNHQAQTRISNLVMTADRAAAHDAIARLQASGSTCISCGLENAYGLLDSVPATHQRRVILLSDGQDGSTPEALGRIASSAMEIHGAPTAAIGLGEGVNERVLQAIATNSTGDYYFMHNSGSTHDILARELGALQNTVVTNLSIELTPVAGVTINETSIVGARRDGASLIIPIGQLSASAHREFTVPLTMSTALSGRLVTATAVYDDESSERRSLASHGSVVRSEDPAAIASARNTQAVVAYERVAAASSVQDAVSTWRDGDYDGALAALRQQEQALLSSAEENDSEDLEREAFELRTMRETLEAAPAPDAPQVEGVLRFNVGRSSAAGSGYTTGDNYYRNDEHDFATTE